MDEILQSIRTLRDKIAEENDYDPVRIMAALREGADQARKQLEDTKKPVVSPEVVSSPKAA